jgi:DNA-binding response OmpR family regulator
MIIMLTAHKSETLSKKAASLGIQGILTKPVKLTHLRIVIGAILDETTLKKPE